MKYCFDLDDTLCKFTGEHIKAIPYPERIAKVNKLYDQGHTIVIETARGSESGIDYFEMTQKQLKDWGLKYHQLRTGKKIFADVYVDDRAINEKDFF